MEDLGTRDPPLNARPARRLTALAVFSTLFALAAVSAVQLGAGQAPAAAAPTPLTMMSRDGRRPIPITIVNGQEYVGFDDLAPIFQLAVREDALGAFTVTYKGRTIVLTADQALASVAGRLVSLPSPTVHNGRRWLVPVEFIARALASIYDTPLDLRKASHLLIVGDLRVPHITVRYDLVAPGARLTIDATPRAASTVSQDNDRLTIRFDADALDINNPPLSVMPAQGPAGLVQSVRLLDATAIAVDTGRALSFRATSQPIETTTRLTIELTAPGSEAAPGVAAAAPPAAAPAPAPALPDLPSLGTQGPSLRTVAIDPGHGGSDAGVKSASGISEKDLALAVARKIKASIEGRLGIRVLLTRDDDRDVPIDDRAAVANNNKADLFISLHANASFRPTAAGATIYYASFDQSAVGTAAAASRPERVPTFGGGSRDIELVEWDQAQTRHLMQSGVFATILQDTLRDRIALAPHPIEQGPFSVLESANMPAVMVEMGFLTSPAQAAQIAGNDFQTTFVQLVTDAVIKFRDALEASAR